MSDNFWKVNNWEDLEKIIEKRLEEKNGDANVKKHLFKGIMMNNKQISELAYAVEELSENMKKLKYAFIIPMFSITVAIVTLVYQVALA